MDINRKIEDFSIVGKYLHFDPNTCLYSQYLGKTYPFWGEAVTGIVKYQKKYYFYTIEEDSNDGTSITLWCEDGDLSNTKFYGTRTKGRLK
ncbi:MAG: hypothetical protein LN546_03725 [Rickettsia endosymbiont of Ecitomorpha arachnoides]|nr:hypothetical protein [Rickettsia endosymbiont of Ecitomorpha arachnoides]